MKENESSVLSYDSEYEQMRALSRRADAETVAVVASGAIGGIAVSALVYVAVSSNLVLLGVAAGVGALISAMFVSCVFCFARHA